MTPMTTPMTTQASKQWYVVYTHPNAEKKLYQCVIERFLEAYLPLQRQVRQWSDRKKVMLLPLFKSYVFVYVDLAGLNTVKTLPGFAQFIRFGGYPVAIPPVEVELMRAVAEHFEDVATVATKLVKGDRVKIVKGALAGYEGILTGDQNSKKVALKVTQLDQSMLVCVADGCVVKI